MSIHYIILSSSYSKGTRIALDYDFERYDTEKLKQVYNRIIEECGKDVSVSTNFITAKDTSWIAVEEADPFFKNIDVIDNVEDFINIINKDRVLNGVDVGKYILAKVKCTHLKLQKLIYFCYAEYLCNNDEKLFNDKIYAYKYGPVIKSVYEKYKGIGNNQIKYEEDDINELEKNIYKLPSKSRILFAKNGIMKIDCIDKTIEKYGNLSAEELVELTHKELTPWFESGKGKYNNKVIQDDIIKKYHCNEII